MTPLYRVRRWNRPGPTHFADNDRETRCGLPITFAWEILEVRPKTPCTCKRCQKKERKP